VFDTVNYDVRSVDTAIYRSGPTLENPDIPYDPNPRYGQYTATLPPREIQLGLRYVY
jgi:hypothetical protein